MIRGTGVLIPASIQLHAALGRGVGTCDRRVGGFTPSLYTAASSTGTRGGYL